MAYTQFGYPAPTVPPSLSTPQLLMPGTTSTGTAGSTTSTTSSGTSCCESGRPIMTDPTTGQTVCSCQYTTTSSLLSSYPRAMAGLDTVYTSAYAAQGYVPFGTDPSAFYSPLNHAYDLKDTANDAWRTLAHPTPCYPYDPTMAAGYPYGQSALAQRKNATREATSTLKAWLQEHIKNPYPTKGEKIMLAIITKMTLTQVSTWFANARRRLKKENKMTWSPRNRTDEDGNKIDSDDEGDGDKDDNKSISGDRETTLDVVGDDDDDKGHDLGLCSPEDDRRILGIHHDTQLTKIGVASAITPPPPRSPISVSTLTANSRGTLESDGSSNSINKPRIWSLADVATSTRINQNSHPIPSQLTAMNTHPSLSASTPPGANTSKLPGLPDSNANFSNPPTGGFRPWVNGSNQPGVYPPTAPSNPQQPSAPAGLLRPYTLAPRPEVH